MQDEVIYGRCYVCGQMTIVKILKTPINGDELLICEECYEKRRELLKVLRERG